MVDSEKKCRDCNGDGIVTRWVTSGEFRYTRNNMCYVCNGTGIQPKVEPKKPGNVRLIVGTPGCMPPKSAEVIEHEAEMFGGVLAGRGKLISEIPGWIHPWRPSWESK